MQVITGHKLAIHGGTPAVSGPLPLFNTIGFDEADAAYAAACGKYPLSGYLGGMRKGGYHVEKLEAAWCEKFNVKHSVACNSATSGVLIACMAIGVKGKTVRTTPYTMSGSVAPAVLLGANVIFGDIDAETYCLVPASNDSLRQITITTNLFGHPSELHPGCTVIEDAAQSILASRDGKLISNALVTVFSGNVHKQIQCGEGGMCCTNDDNVADAMRMARNHGELAGRTAVGLNLRLTEVQAAIWYVQLQKAEQIIAGRRAIAEALSKAASPLGLTPRDNTKPGCVHSYYVWALRCTGNASWIAKALLAEGVPVKLGYMTPLYKLPAFKQPIKRKVVEETDVNLIIYENCSYDPTPEQLKQMQTAFEKVAEHAHRQS